jgi:hypothetical protein
VGSQPSYNSGMRRVLMNFDHCDYGWRVHFIEADCRTLIFAKVMLGLEKHCLTVVTSLASLYQTVGRTIQNRVARQRLGRADLATPF